VQAEGGPCGLLAAVQGELLAVLQEQRGRAGSGHYESTGALLIGMSKHPHDAAALHAALLEALATMLWQAASSTLSNNSSSTSTGTCSIPDSL